MRIVQVFQPEAGGVPQHVHDLVGGLVERGHEVTAVTSRTGPMRERLRERGARVVELDLRPELLSAGRSAPVLRDLVAMLHRERHDVLHAHGGTAGGLGRVAARITGTPGVYSPHCFAYRAQALRARRFRKARTALTYGIERALGAISSAVVCVSEEEHRAAERDRIAPPERLRLIRYGVAAEDAVPDGELMRWRGEGPLLGFMANLREQKGLPTLVDALALLRDRGALPRFAIVGEGEDRDWLAGRLAEERLTDRVLLHPFGGVVWPHLAAFDAFVLPSWWEALPIAVLEAMAAGLPVVASDVNGTGEAVVDERTGLLVPARDPAALADAIARVATDAGLRERMAAAALEEAAQKWRLERMVRELESLYLEVGVGRSSELHPWAGHLQPSS